ncbi:Zn-ribbon domain-containing OB-fold protein [Candidatus Chloroploca sp. M-50]|uniref:Zn-ribbon domain-containing OB-fold protein n=1 Tax=Candidatus Chloroploca mongolica TaxID=2528176 RepID=A0ABS4DAW3_9CHLR|nr:Zn-ribbon domain-containing OB-fold protein [Candidatus Chloroploca mongolica]MBP1466581.1 Zn-ribbon domain-containing OB-fold protein [Candidatus Chloroploca mongolica]
MEIARHWRQRAARYRLQGQRHRETGEVRFPAQPPAIGEDPTVWEAVDLSGRGELYSFSVLRQGPDGYEGLVPYPVGMVRLEEGPLVAAQLTDCAEADLAIGQSVEMVTRQLLDTGEDNVLVYGYKFRPVLV